MVKAAPVSVPEGPSWWVEGARDDRLAPWGQAKLWALHRVNQELGLGMDDAAMAELVQKPNGEPPSKQAVQKFRPGRQERGEAEALSESIAANVEEARGGRRK